MSQGELLAGTAAAAAAVNPLAAMLANPDAIAKLPVENLERLINLRNAELDRQAALEFAESFAAMQRELTPVPKERKRKGHNSRYAPLPVIIDHVGPFLTKHGFSWRWSFDDKRDEMRVRCVLTHTNGHSEYNEMSAEPDDSGGKNKIQGRASANSYMERYTFIGVTGCTVEGEDDDGGKPRVTLEELLKHNDAIMRNLTNIAWAVINADNGMWEACAEAFYEISDEDRPHLGRARTKGGILNDHYKGCFLSDEFKAAKLSLGIHDADGKVVRDG